MRIIKVDNVDEFEISTTPLISSKTKQLVEEIISDVRNNGDSALKKYEKQFNMPAKSLIVSKKEIQQAYSEVSKYEIAALRESKKRLKRTEKTLRSQLKGFTTKSGGIKISKKFTSISSVGCYVPGGLARYPSSAIMSIVPAKIAGVKRIVVVSPPNKQGKIDPMTLVAADICGATEIYATGGAQAIAALAYGTKTIQSVDKVIGPGGSFVTTAKFLISRDIEIDMLAGPTELGIIADSSANARYVAADLISQAEHGKDTFCYVITDSNNKAKEIKQILKTKIGNIQRNEIVKSSLKNNGLIAVCKTKKDVIDLANWLAPEHLQIIAKNPRDIANKITTAGLVLYGEYTPSAASDYLLGSNHILPTMGFGRARSSLSVLDFVKLNTTITSTKSDLAKISKHMKALTDSEGLFNHYESVRERL